MAVSIAMPQQQEAGFDKFLRRATGIANIAKGGLDAYQGFTDFRDKQQMLDDQKAGVRMAKDIDMGQFQEAAEGDAGAEAFQIRDGDNVVTRLYKKRAAEGKAMSPLEAAQAAADLDYKKAQTWALKNKPSEAQERASARAEEKAIASQEKKMAAMNEVEDRRRNILDNVDLVDKMIADKGTFEMFGSHNQDLDRRVDMIATDMAKLADPSSVARPSEVEMFKKGLVESGLGKRNSTARDLLSNFKNEVEQRAANAYEVRGLADLVKQRKQNQAPAAKQDSEAVSWAKSNPNDPRAQKILEMNGVNQIAR